VPLSERFLVASRRAILRGLAVRTGLVTANGAGEGSTGHPTLPRLPLGALLDRDPAIAIIFSAPRELLDELLRFTEVMTGVGIAQHGTFQLPKVRQGLCGQLEWISEGVGELLWAGPGFKSMPLLSDP
jgi:hypothetical protein